MPEEMHAIKRKSFNSVMSLFAQGAFSAALGFTAFFMLTLKSGIYLLGIYNTVLATMSAFNYFTDLGLGAAIMQRKEVKQIDLNSAFYIQFILTTLAVIIGYYLSPRIFNLYKDLPHSALYLYWSLLVAFFFLSLKSIPSVLLEKDIEIYKVVLVQAVENTVFYLIIIIMVFMGYGIESLIVGVLARGIIGTILMFIMKPWFPTLSFSWQSSKQLLKYGIPFQGNSLLALVKDDLMIIYLGSAIGLTNLGIVAFGKKYAEFSIKLIMDNINRVAFPVFARFQNDKDLLKRSLRKVYFYESLFIFALMFGGMFIFDSVLKVVPGGYYEKWHLALFSFYFFSFSAFFVSMYSPLISFFNAVGRVKVSLAFMVYFTAVNWICIPIAIRAFGYNAISVAFFVISLSFFMILMKAKEVISFSLFSFIRTNLLAAFVMCLYLTMCRVFFLHVSYHPLLHVLSSLAGGGIIYIGMIYRYSDQEFVVEVKKLFHIAV